MSVVLLASQEGPSHAVAPFGVGPEPLPAMRSIISKLFTSGSPLAYKMSAATLLYMHKLELC